jgi:lincosamide nucleotidyltransferase A/C/D/E
VPPSWLNESNNSAEANARHTEDDKIGQVHSARIDLDGLRLKRRPPPACRRAAAHPPLVQASSPPLYRLTSQKRRTAKSARGARQNERVTRLSGRGRSPKKDMDAARVLDLLEHLERHGIVAWLDGGWGIDAALGRQTRRHDDLDLVASLDKSDTLEAALGEHGYAIAGGGAPSSFELVDPDGHQVDVHPVRFTPEGVGLYRMETGEEWVYPAAGFTGRGRILGRSVRCLTPEVLMLCHATGYELDAEHHADVMALSEQFGLAIPASTRFA